MIKVLKQHWKLPNPHTTVGGVGDLTTASKKLIVKLVDKSNNSINDLLHSEDVNKFVRPYIREQAKSSPKHILGNL